MRVFLRTGTRRYKRLGRTKKLRWRKPRGRHNKIREKRKGRMRKVEIGFRTSRKERGKWQGKVPFLVKNIKDTEKISNENFVILAKMGKKKKEEIMKKISKGGK